MPLGNTTLITRCPDCLTAFRATPEQLAMRDGHVRCGNCGMVFDARANLLDPDTLQLLQPPPAEEDSAIPAGAPAEIAIQPHETSSAVTAAVTEPRDEFVHPHEDFHTGESEAVNPPVDPSVDALESPPSIATTPDEPPDEAPQQDVDNSGSPAPAEDEYNRAEEAHLDDGPMVEDHAASAVIAQDPMGESHAAPDSALAAEAIPERPDDRGPESATEDATDQTQALATATPMPTPMPTPVPPPAPADGSAPKL